MPYLDTAQQWLTQSTLLLKARPSTTRITTKYTITPSTSKSKAAKTKSKSEFTIKAEPETSTTTPPAPLPSTLTLKTYDPASGVTLKYSTNKAAEVSRLIQILGRLARPMAGLPEIKEEVLIKSEEVAEGSGPGTPAVESVPSVVGGGKVGGGQQGGGQGGVQTGKKGKKKGKK